MEIQMSVEKAARGKVGKAVWTDRGDQKRGDGGKNWQAYAWIEDKLILVAMFHFSMAYRFTVNPFPPRNTTLFTANVIRVRTVTLLRAQRARFFFKAHAHVR